DFLTRGGVDHGSEELARGLASARPVFVQRAGNAAGLQKREIACERFALCGEMEQALAAVGLSSLLHDVALFNEIAQHASEALLGDLEDVEQVRDAHAGVAVDEMQHAMMRAAEAQPREALIGVADEVAIGEEQELDEVIGRPAGLAL